MMLYDLSATPAVTLVGPDDTSWWAALGQDPAGRSALILGDPTDPTTALVITAPLPDLGTYLHRWHAALVSAVQASGNQPRTAPSAAPASDLVTLPHSGIRVPDAALRVTSYRELPTEDGVAYTATVRWGNIPVGTLHNEGIGGLTTFAPAAGSLFDSRRLDAFVAASRGADGQPLAEDELFEALVTEYENVAHVAAATRAGRSPIRLRAPLGAGDGLDDVYYTALRNTVPTVATPGQRDALRAALTLPPAVDGGWWQLWTGQAWEDLTTPTPAGGQGPR
jgi:hypothetical protein